ncbi:gamma subclass chorismate mutase AroQ [Amycolatopsis sp. NPDC059027]|uniref:gamma subclass chorismate mutase AroQ n=1 Tax=Amycolatopsis sp. NPDC059027 TaxID=3346709 RepID=UPI003672F8A5
MSGVRGLTRPLVVSAMIGALLLGGVSAASATVPTPVPAPTLRAWGPLGALTDLAVRRILLGDKVAAAKFGTDQPIDDPVREQKVLDSVRQLSLAAGIDPAASVRFFQDQIEANKIVQRGLYALWTAHPELRPTHRPDLATEVRPQLDRITTGIIEQLAATASVRQPTLTCEIDASVAKISAEIQQRLDALHRQALTVALRKTCSGPATTTSGAAG